MHFGLIHCDKLAGPICWRYGDYPAMFAKLLQPLSNQITWQVFEAVSGQLPTRVNECDAYIITGSRFGVLDRQAWIDALIGFIQSLWQSRIQTLGICFGHQVMAAAMGASVGPSSTGWCLGISPTQIIQRQDWMQPFQSEINIGVSHQDQVLTLPAQGLCLARTNHTPIAAIAYEQTFLSLQGHPEFDKHYTRFLLNKRQPILSPQTFQNFQNSLALSLDTTIISNWIGHFFKLRG